MIMVRRVFLMALNMSLQLLALQNSTAAESDIAVDNGSDWTYHDEEWHGNHPDDTPSRWVLVGSALDDRSGKYCMTVRTPVESGQAIGMGECDWSIEEQLFFWEEGKRMRPLLDISLCVDANEGSWPVLRDCQLKGPQQRWNVAGVGTSDGMHLSPKTNPELCLVPTDVSRGSIDYQLVEFSRIGRRECAEWKEQVFPGDHSVDSDTSDVGQQENITIDEESELPLVPETSDSEYVLLINREHDYDDPNAKCLMAANTDRGELKLVKCNQDNPKHQWLNEEFAASSTTSAAIRLRPKSDPSLCVTRGKIDKPPSDIHCCVDDTRLHLKTCDGSSKQLWRYDHTYGFFSPIDYDTLCIASWFDSRVGLSYCSEKSSHGEYRFDFVDPGNGLTRPEAISERAEDMFWVESVVDQIPRRLWCSVLDGGQNCKVVMEKDYWDGDIDEDFDSVDAIWLRDDDGRIRSASDQSICLTFDDAYDNTYATACYQYRDGQQIWHHDAGGNMELSPEYDLEVCVAAKLGNDPPVEPCRGVNKHSWTFVPFMSEGTGEPSTCDDDLDGAYMIVWKGGEGYYCVEGGDDSDDELGLEQCDPTNQNQIFLYENNRWMPKHLPELCVQAVKNEDTEGLRVPMLMPCDGSNKQKWTLDDGQIQWAKYDNLCASYHFDERTYFYNFVLKDCANEGSDDDQSFQLISPREYTAPMLKYVLLSTKNDLSWGISCYPDHEENTCPGYRPIRTTYGKFYEGTKWFVEQIQNGIRLRRGSPRGPMLKVDGHTTWIYDGNTKELKSTENGKCVDNRGQIGEPCKAFPCDNCDSYYCFGSSGDLTLAKCTGSSSRQKWILQDSDKFLREQGSALFGEPNENDFRLLVSSKSRGLCVAAKDPYARHPDGDIVLMKCSPSDPKQIWAVENIDGGKRMRLKDNLSVCMHVSRVELLQTLHLEKCDDLQRKQKWLYNGTGNGNISPTKNENLCVGFDYEDGCLQVETPLELLPCSGEEISEQSFDLIRPVDYPGDSPE